VPLAVRFDDDTTLDFRRSLSLLERTVPALKPKRSTSFTIQYRMSHSGSPTGKLLFARVDPSNVVAEASEANNRFERPIP
jgi:subtilase family serine protease